ncbi:MAG: hypothetical protein K0S04_480 [Herbinix sp.]|nr:hypothetical protein [Herbinix sp.]
MMKNKLVRIIIILVLLFNACLGFIIFLIDNLRYRYNRVEIWMEQDELNNQLFMELQRLIPIAWMVWGVLVLLTILLLINEFRKKS